MAKNELMYQKFVQQFAEIWPDYHLPTKNEYLNPTTDTVVRFLDRFLTSINKNVDERVRKTLNRIPHGETYKDLLYVIVLHKYMREFLMETSLSILPFNSDSFKVGSLLQPSPRQMNCLFQCVGNFVLFQTGYKMTLDGIYKYYEQQAHKVADALKYQENNTALESQLAMQQFTSRSYKSELLDKIADNAAAVKEMLTKKKEQEEQLDYLQANVSLLENKNTQLLELDKELDTQIAEYEEYHRMLEELEVLTKEKETTSDHRTSKILKSKAEQKEQYEKGIKAEIFSESQKTFLDVLTTGEELEENLKNIENQITEVKSSQKIYAQRKTENSKRIQVVEEAIQTLHVQWKDAEAVFKQEQQNGIKELNMLETRKMEYDSEVYMLHSEIAVLERKIAEAEEQEKTIKNHWLKNYSLILQSTRDLHLACSKAERDLV